MDLIKFKFSSPLYIYLSLNLNQLFSCIRFFHLNLYHNKRLQTEKRTKSSWTKFNKKINSRETLHCDNKKNQQNKHFYLFQSEFYFLFFMQFPILIFFCAISRTIYIFHRFNVWLILFYLFFFLWEKERRNFLVRFLSFDFTLFMRAFWRRQIYFTFVRVLLQLGNGG